MTEGLDFKDQDAVRQETGQMENTVIIYKRLDSGALVALEPKTGIYYDVKFTPMSELHVVLAIGDAIKLGSIVPEVILKDIDIWQG